MKVHPLMTNVPVLACKRISNETGRHLPVFTVVTDLGSAHCLWFANGVEKMFVGSESVKELAKARGKVAEEKLVLSGLPIRHDFAVQADKLGDRMSKEGKQYQVKVRDDLDLPFTDRKTLLVMGGGEGTSFVTACGRSTANVQPYTVCATLLWHRCWISFEYCRRTLRRVDGTR